MKLYEGIIKKLIFFWIIILLSILCVNSTGFTFNQVTLQEYQTRNELIKLALINDSLNNLDSTIFLYQKLIFDYEKNLQWDSSVYFRNEISRILIKNDSVNKALISLEETKRIIDDSQFGDKGSLANWYVLMGQIKFSNDAYLESLVYYDSSLFLVNQEIINDKEFSGDLYNKMGLSYTELASYRKALNCYKLSVDSYNTDINKFYHELFLRYLKLSKVYSLLYKIDSSEIYLFQAKKKNHEYRNISYKSKQKLYEELSVHYMKTNMQDSALHYIYKNIETSKKFTKSAFHEGQSYNLLGLIYKGKGDFFKAINYYKKNIHIYDSALGYMHINSAHSRENLGVLYMDMMDFDSAVLYMESALSIRLKKMPENSPAIGNSYLNIGNTHFYMSDFSMALEYYKKAASLYLNAYGEDHIYVNFALGNIGAALNNLGRHEEALSYFNKVKTKNKKNTRNLLNIGIVWSKLEIYDSALYYLNFCLDERLSNLSELHTDVAGAYYHLGMVYQKIPDHKKAMVYFLKAEEIFTSYYGRKHNQIAQCNLHMAEISRKDSLMNEALNYIQKGLIAIALDFESLNVSNNPNLSDYKILTDKTYIDLIRLKADIFYEKYNRNLKNLTNLEEAYKLYLCCMDQIPIVTRNYKNEVTRLKLYNEYSGIYSNALSIHFELSKSTNTEDAFSIVESGKAQLLYESIMESLAMASSNIDNASKIKERQLLLEINLVEDKILKLAQDQEAVDSIEFAQLENKYFDLKLNYKHLKEMFEKNYSDYYNLKYNTQVASIEDVQNTLSPNQALMEYALSDSTLFVFAITKEKSSIIKIPIDTNFNILIEEYRNLNFKKQLKNAEWQIYLDNSYKLYSILIEPLSSQINKKELIIIPDKEIGYIPFETLVTKRVSSNKMDYSDLPWLIKKHPISYGYSATLYINSRSTVSENNDLEVLAFAPFSKDQITNVDQNTLSLLRERGILDMNLVGASNEVKAISKFYKTDIYFDSAATEKRFWESSGNYNIIHIASHGIIDDKNPSYSRLLFRNISGDSIYDGNVHTYELFEKQLNAQLVVLSACNTGMGEIHKGEGVMSLARGFLYTGVPGIVMTLWSVDDQSSAELMNYFYKYLKAGDPKNIALQKAKLDYLSETTNPEKIHPKYWAGYVLIGDESAIVRSRSKSSLILISLILILSLITLVIIKKRKGARV